MNDVATTKKCSLCKVDKPLEEFNKDRKQSSGLYPQCRICANARRKELRKGNPQPIRENVKKATAKWRERNPLYSRKSYVRNRYGGDPNEIMKYAATKALEQNYQCAICGRKGEVIGLVIKKNVIRLVLDHNHKTGQFRGMLCDYFNKALGMLGDDPETIEKAFNYLKKWGK